MGTEFLHDQFLDLCSSHVMFLLSLQYASFADHVNIANGVYNEITTTGVKLRKTHVDTITRARGLLPSNALREFHHFADRLNHDFRPVQMNPVSAVFNDDVLAVRGSARDRVSLA